MQNAYSFVSDFVMHSANGDERWICLSLLELGHGRLLGAGMVGSAGGRNMEEKAAKWREEGQARKPTRECGSERDVLTTVV